VIGSDKFAYDLWGDTVNTASRMESSGVPDAIQITERTQELLQGAYECEPRGPIEVKGKGTMQTFLLRGRR
jgi:adenylate cyclase